MKKTLIFIALIFFGVLSCQKEPAIAPTAHIRTNLVDNTVAKKIRFRLYLDQSSGDFITYFKGDTPKKTYNKDDLTVTGVIVDENADSIDIAAYTVAGTYTFTLVAKSYGSWGDEELQAVDSIKITVN
jgi:hypothetical protein